MASATVPLLDSDTTPFGDGDDMNLDVPKRYNHPYVTFFHLFFRCAAIVIYMFCGWFTDSFITSFVFIVLFLSADFWTVKNITGRLLVGLRWWNYIDDKGASHWVFESKQTRIESSEVRLFWLGLIFCPLFWSLFFFVAIFKANLKWLLLVIIALALNGANLYGYIKCNYGNSKNLNVAATDFVRTQIFRSAVDAITRNTSTNQPSATSRTSSNIV